MAESGPETSNSSCRPSAVQTKSPSMIHPDTELRHVNEKIGYGVFATKPIHKGTISWVCGNLDQESVTAEIEQIRSALANYFLPLRGS